MSNWFHEVRGKYDVKDRWIGLDFGKLFLDAQATHLTLAHEVSHGVIAMTEFGQATHVVYRLINDFKHLNKSEKKQLGQLLYNSQLFVQEGLATFMQVGQLRKMTSHRNALSWAQNELPTDYYARLEKLLFAFEMSQRYRDYFTGKLCDLAMETGIRKLAPKLDLFGSLDKIKQYLSDSDNNPDSRMEKIISVLKYKPWLVTKPIPIIAEACGVTHHDITTKDEVVAFLNYMNKLAGGKRVFTTADIGDTPKGADAFTSVAENMIVANMNINLTNPTEVLFNFKDFLFYADKMEIVFINPYDGGEDKDLIKHVSGLEPEVNLAGFLPTGERYLGVATKEMVEKALNKELSKATFFVKWGGFNPIKNKLIWSNSVRPPNLVIYNRPQEMKTVFEEILKKKPKISIRHLHAGATVDHPFQTLIVKIKDTNTIHAVNGLFAIGIGEVIKIIEKNSKVMTNRELRNNKKSVNNLLALWMGLHWEIDWVESMIDGKELHFR